LRTHAAPFLLLLAFAIAAPARAADEPRFVRYRIEIDAPGALREIIERSIGLAR
jgi:hypothetical protein